MSILRIRPAILVTVLCLIYALAVVAQHGDALALVTIGEQFKPDDIAYTYTEEGYDGQFVYYIARDPSNAAPYLDVPAYRFQRILLPALAMPVPDTLIPWVLLAVNLVALAGGTALVEHFLQANRLSRWYALSYGLTLGTFGAARLSLPEPLAYALVLGGIFFAQREKWLVSALLFALAALAKETALVFVAGYGLYLLMQKRWGIMVLFGAVSTVPFIIWQFILRASLGSFGVGSGGALSTPFEIIPFGGVIRLITELPPGAEIGRVIVYLIIFAVLLIPFVLIPTIWGLIQCWRDYQTRSWTVYTYLLFANAILMLFVPFSTYREPIGILRFIVGLQIAVILYAAERRNFRVLRSSTLWIITLLFVVPSDFAPPAPPPE